MPYLGAISVPTTPVGFGELLSWASALGPVLSFGIEGTGSFGAGLTRWLNCKGQTVLEVDRPDRWARYRDGRSDPLDAETAARAVLSGRATGGFAFEALVGEDSGKIGRLIVLKAKMNPDLQMPDLLKKTGAGNLFVVFGEPDIEIRPGEEEAITVEVRGVDVYDPTTGQVRSHSTDDIASWFIDTDYNGETFFVRHAYFLGGDDPYGKLKRALRADIDQAAWDSLYSATSRPFPRPSTGKIAVKVINHFGDEILKVYEV